LFACDNDDFGKQDMGLATTIPKSTLNNDRDVIIKNIIHCTDIVVTVLVGLDVLLVDGLCPAFNAHQLKHLPNLFWT
jgi:hypothetical protein